VELIVKYNISIIYLVMDGKRCPLKADETQDREQKRQEHLLEARNLVARGQRNQAVEKYKACIRVRNDFTEAVMKAFQKLLHGERRMLIVWSPYEADAQLAKLCVDNQADAVVTEDSDILVYSAAAHVAFPVLFKLNRHTGSCDMISMDFLLSMSPEDADRAVKSNNNFECMLQKLASRQAKRTGLGVRLFVQGCVLGGCDYSINTLEGVGLINAFKLVRDNAFRNDSVRFKKILQSLPAKVRKKLDIDRYEERLTKSEAVFYYHLVKHSGGETKPLLTPRISCDDANHDAERTQHFPFMQRFENDWSFLGKLTPPMQDLKIEEDLYLDEMPAATTNICVAEMASPAKRNPKVVNPYLRTKTIKQWERPPLKDKQTNSQYEKSESKSQLGTLVKSKGNGPDFNIYKYLQEMPDVRYVKRTFPFTTRTRSVSSKRRNVNSPQWRNVNTDESEHQSAANIFVKERRSNPFARFKYVDSPSTEQDECSNAGDEPLHSEKESFVDPSRNQEEPVNSPIRGLSLSIDHLSDQEPPSTKSQGCQLQQVLFDLTESDDERTGIKANNAPFATIEFDHGRMSTDNVMKADGVRRVTLDSGVSGLATNETEKSFGKSDIPTWHRRNTVGSSLESGDLVPFPECEREQRNDSSLSRENQRTNSQKRSNEGRPSNSKISSSPYSLKMPKSKRMGGSSGPLLAGFKRQQEFFNQVEDPMPRSYAYSSSKKPKRSQDLTSFFQPFVKTCKPQFHQLTMETNQNDEDFLWNG
jgi:5'-3' exonuclease